jgi:uncharacterized protein YfaT (DUF1175 family)
MINVTNKTRATVLLLLLWFVFVFLVAYISPGLSGKKASTPVASGTTRKASTISPAVLNAADSRALDADKDGIPDAAELSTYADRESFRRWFTLIAEMQFYRLSDQWNPEQRDCAGLVRFAWREALRRHDRLWFQKMGPGYEAIAPDVTTSETESRLLGDKLFRTDFGRYEPGDEGGRSFSEFADARTLKNFNTVFISRDRRQAQPGDLLFFYQPWVQKYPYHIMIYLGGQSVAPGGAGDWVVYHTGASPTGEGTVKKVRLSVLDHHPDARWRPVESNRNFIGFYRLKILD